MDTLWRYGASRVRPNQMTEIRLAQGLQRTGPLDVEAVLLQAVQGGFSAFVLPAKGIVDQASFFDAMRATFPLDPPVRGSHSWDALSDSLWEGLYVHESRRIAILWPGAHEMANSAATDFETAIQMLASVANVLANSEATLGNPKEVAILVE